MAFAPSSNSALKEERDPNKLRIGGTEPGMVWEEIKPKYSDEGTVIFEDIIYPSYTTEIRGIPHRV